MDTSFSCRHYFYLRAAGNSHESALASLQSIAKLAGKPSPMISPLLNTEKLPTDQHQALSAALTQEVEGYQFILDNQHKRWMASAGYIAILMSMATIIAIIALVYVTPQFDMLFGNKSLPAFTRIISGNSHILIPSLIIFNIGLLIGFGIIAKLYQKKVAIFSLPPPIIRWIPGLDQLLEATHRAYGYSLVRAQLLAGRATNDALAHVEATFRQVQIPIKHLFLNDRHAKTAYSDAQQLGTFEQEFLYQANASNQQFAAAVGKAHTRCWMVIQALTACIVATLVFAIYLPIFKLGAVL